MRLLALALLLALPIPAAAADFDDRFYLRDLEVGLEGRHVVAFFRLQPGLPEEILERIQSGLSSGLTYHFRLYIDHIRWFDNAIDESSLEISAMYNALTREYLVNYEFNGKLIQSRIVKSAEALAAAMTQIEGLQIFTVPAVPDDVRLLVRARADLGSRTLLGFIPSAVTTDWVESAKFRPPGSGA